jgi:hypothetical protein
MANKIKEMLDWIVKERQVRENDNYKDQKERAKAILALIIKRKGEKQCQK